MSKLPSNLFRHAAIVAVVLLLVACQQSEPPSVQRTESEPPAQTETQRLMAFFEQAHQQDVARSPMMQARLGIRDDYDQWDDLSEAHAEEGLEIARQRLQRLAGFDRAALEPRARLSYDLFERLTQRRIDDHRWRDHSYPINQMFGWQQQIPTFLINMHRVGELSDAEAYIARLEGVGDLIDQILARMRAGEARGVLPPRFVYPIVLEASRNVVTGTPFEEVETESVLLGDFRRKVAGLDLPEDQADALVARATQALAEVVAPAYARLIAELERQQALATEDHGVWKLPDGDTFYRHMLSNYTTTELTPNEIHQMGLENVARIHDEMREIMAEVGFDGDLQDFFAFMRSDEQFYYPNTDAGRAEYLAEATALIQRMNERLPEMFGRFPEAELEVRRVEPFRERAAGKAFYQAPALDGSRPGVYYANLYDMGDMPIYQMEALAYHEGNPGHHMQIAIAQELEGVPAFQRLARFSVYSEGWGLYTEYLPLEMGFYEDPYSNFGRLAMELWRAVRLVVDTGIHAKGWTREQAIDYHLENTPNPRGDVVKAVERYIVMPGQATAYLIGKIRILELREAAREALGEAFDIRGFHDEVLADGPVPLDLLKAKVDDWVGRLDPSS
ncbi:MAG: DUF885 domain-containing protein [Wenzhouxiangellaceae bacterium]|nr:DUF885 domain-containing protein [Wenzhouxiangellaceae bacterium]